MSSRDRALSIVELLAGRSDGMHLADIASELSLPRSATHRLLNDLRETGYVRQEHERGIYSLSVKLASLALVHQISTGMTDLVLPLLDRLAEQSGELVMISIVEGDRLMRVAKARGARRGLQYNPEEVPEVYLGATSNGFAYLSTLDPDDALRLAARQGIQPGNGPNAPKSIAEIMVYVERARERGYSEINGVFEAGTSAVAAPIYRPNSTECIATVSVAGPSIRLTDNRIQEIVPFTLEAAKDIGIASERSAMFQPRKMHQ